MPANRGGTQRERDQAAARQCERILDQWAEGRRTATIAASVGCSETRVKRVVRVGRREADPRAHRRHHETGQGGRGFVPYWADPRQMALPFPAAQT
jgi:hypothetical protein